MTELHAPARLGGRYELGQLIGSGGTSQVHRGVDLVLGRPVAIKVFRADVAFHDRARMEAEGRTLAALNHPGLVAVYDAGTARTSVGDEARYLVMELIDGPSLAVAAHDGSLAPTDITRLGADLGDALAHVHGQGIVHRDIKPANVLIDRTGRAKITDFGIARLIDSARATATGLTIGTAAYLSPEQLTGASVGPASDVYSLGLVLLECLTGRREYPGAGVESAMARLHRSPNIPVSLPNPWPGLITAMTRSDPMGRPSAADVAGVLRSTPGAAYGPAGLPAPETMTAALATGSAGTLPVTTQLPLSMVPPVPPVPPQPPDESRAGSGGVRRWSLGFPRRALIAAVAVLATVAVVLTGAVLAGGGGRPPSPTTSPTSGSTFARDLSDLNRAVTP